MADVVVTPAEVLPVTGSGPGADTQIDFGTFGTTVTAGQTVYKDSTGLYQLADSNLSIAAAAVTGIALNGGAANQPAAVAIGGTIDPGFTVDPGEIYVLSGTAGGIAPVADITTGWRTSIVGVGLTASSLKLLFYASGVVN
jgi:hypothetical protein